MCGIAGVLQFEAQPGLETAARAMADTLAHRGPDTGNVWCDPVIGIALANRRLSIIDVSSAGLQPMVSADGRYVITYNGEIYNAGELRGELNGKHARFRGHSDTEVMLEAIAAWGIRRALQELNGMFAFALWDRCDRRLFLVRDRLGIKPAFWTQNKGQILFGSELKALLAHPACPREINRDAVATFLRKGYVPAPQTIYRGVHKLAPGHILEIAAADGIARIEPFWQLSDAVRTERAPMFNGSDADAVDELARLLGDAVDRQVVADVPLGVFLSGGIDSSTVAALMSRSGRQVRSFTMGFSEETHNEASYASEIAKHLGTEHTEFLVTGQDARDVIPYLPDCYDEPFADWSQLPTWLLAKLTRQYVTVALSGDGGDELFGGYKRYVVARAYAHTIGSLPTPLRALAGSVIRGIPAPLWNKLATLVAPSIRSTTPGDKLHELADAMTGDLDSFYRRMNTHWDPVPMDTSAVDDSSISADETKALIPDFTDRMMYQDTIGYLPDDLLTKLDRASMAHSLEVRVPLLDHRIVEFAWRLPRSMKLRSGQGKWLLRQVLRRHVPSHLFERPKMGFAVPMDSWLRGPLRDWAGDLLSPQSIRRHGLIDAEPVQNKWREHLVGERNWQYQLWNALMLQAWCNRWLS